jgi:cob(I)alamin adenosyltransferase
MKIYTRGGDTGKTALVGGRVYKDNVRVAAYGELDELNAYVGVALAEVVDAVATALAGSIEALDAQDAVRDKVIAEMKDSGAIAQKQTLMQLSSQLEEIMHVLFDCGADLAFVDDGSKAYKVQPDKTAQLEKWIDGWTETLTPILKFILPGGSKSAAALHVCRTVCRRVERTIVGLVREIESQDVNKDKPEQTNLEVLKYVNRLSDYFFTVARVANSVLNVQDVEYRASKDVFR